MDVVLSLIESHDDGCSTTRVWFITSEIAAAIAEELGEPAGGQMLTPTDLEQAQEFAKTLAGWGL